MVAHTTKRSRSALSVQRRFFYVTHAYQPHYPTKVDKVTHTCTWGIFMHATAYFHVVGDALFNKSLNFQFILFHIVIVSVEFIDQIRGSLNQLIVKQK